MNAALHLVVTLLVCTWMVRPLARAQWVWRAPRAGIVLWQMLVATWILCAVGTFVAIGLAPYGRDIPTAFGQWLAADVPAGFTTAHLVVLAAGLGIVLALLVALGLSWIGVLRTRRRHRQVLSLVAREDPAAPGALILEHPLAVAYCLPGIRGRVVLSSGALAALDPDQVAAVLAHERTHVRERHDLVLLPFAAFRRLMPRFRLLGLAAAAVALLVEMRADEGACRRQKPGSLATALRRFDMVSPPPGALGVNDAAVSARLKRISGNATPLPLTVSWLVMAAGAGLVSTPLSFLVF
jgi:Zn-dependent protease with chaperone function